MAGASEQRGSERDPTLAGTILLLAQFDVCEEIRTDDLQKELGAASRKASGTQYPSSSYIRYERPPVIQPIQGALLAGEGSLTGELKYYDYGVLSVVFHLPFKGEWDDLISLACRWIWDVDFTMQAERIVRDTMERTAAYMVNPYTSYLSEDYLIFHLTEIAGIDDASQVVSRYGSRIAQVVRGDTGELAESEIAEVMRAQISYYKTDLAVVGWNAAFLYDTIAGGGTAIQLLEYANSQLLEFRHYDEQLTRELDKVYRQLKGPLGTWTRWRLARSATRLQADLLEIAELTERTDNAIKFLSDMFSARLYRLSAARVGVPDYRDLVAAKVRVAEELYQFMVDQFNQSRAFILELTVVIILIVEIVLAVQGKPF